MSDEEGSSTIDPYWDPEVDDAMLIIMWIQYGCGIFGLALAPLYFLFQLILDVYFMWKAWVNYWLRDQRFVVGTDKYAFSGWLLYPFRKMLLHGIFSLYSLSVMVPFVGWIFDAVLFTLQWINMSLL